MNLLSFENVLRSHAGITVVRKPRAFAIKRSNTVSADYPDDDLSTVAASVLDELHALYPKLHSFKHCPMVSMGSGCNLGDFLADFDSERFEDLRSSFTDANNADADYYAQAYDNYSAAKSMAENSIGGLDEVIHKSVMIENIFKVFFKQRRNPVNLGEGEPLPYVEWHKAFDVAGSVRGVSRLPEAIKTGLLQAHPTGTFEGDDFILRAPLDVFYLINGKAARPTLGDILTELDNKDKVSSGLSADNRAEPAVTSASGGPDVARHEPSTPCEDVNAGIEHVERWACENINRNHDEAVYGFEGGKKYYFALSQRFRDRLAAFIQPGESLIPSEAIRRIADAMINAGFDHPKEGPVGPVSFRMACLLAGGRFVAWKGNYSFAEKWTRK